jgi:L-cysteine/cystine lyase
VRERVAELLAAPPEHISLTNSTTDGCNIVLSGLGLKPEDEIVTTDSEHFGLAGPVFASGATVRVAGVQGLGPDEALEAIVAEVTPRTRLLAVSHVLWTTGIVLDVHALKERTGLPIVVDGAQSSERSRSKSALSTTTPCPDRSGSAAPSRPARSTSPDVDALRVSRPAYWAQESFEPGGRYVPRAGAQRFDPGWISVASLNALALALDLAPDWRYDRIREAAARCREALAEHVAVVTPPGQAGLVTFRPGGDPEEAAFKLFEQGIVLRNIPGTPWLRASCGWWTSDDDIARLADQLAVG